MLTAPLYSIGKGFQGAMVRWGFKGMPASHGVSLTHRHIGSTGGRTDPGRTFKGKKMAGRMGGHYVTVKKAKVVRVDTALNCIYVSKPVAGHEGAAVRISDSTYNPIFESIPPPLPTYLAPSPSAVEGAGRAAPALPRIMNAKPSPRDTLEIQSNK